MFGLFIIKNIIMSANHYHQNALSNGEPTKIYQQSAYIF